MTHSMEHDLFMYALQIACSLFVGPIVNNISVSLLNIFHAGSSVIPITSFTYTERSLPIYINDLNCTGSEESVWECPHNGIEGYSCGYNRDDARLICSGMYVWLCMMFNS